MTHETARTTVAAFFGVLAASCAHNAPPALAPTNTPTEAPSKSDVASEVLGAMDPQADPCQDFYQYACGTWLQNTKLPADKPSWTRSFSSIYEHNLSVLHDLLEQAAADAAKADASGRPGEGDADWRKMGRFYGACMDTDAVEQAGLTGLKPLLDEIDAITGPDGKLELKAFAKVVGEMQLDGMSPFFRASADADFKNPDLVILYLDQGGLALPDRDYYMPKDEPGRKLLDDYRAHIARMFTLMGEDDATAHNDAEAVLDLETAIAKFSKPKAELRDPRKTYHKVDREGLVRLAPDIDWDRLFAASGIPNVEDISVATPEYFTDLDLRVTSTDPATLKAYLRWNLVNSMAGSLNEAFVDAHFDFFGKKVYGIQEIEPRWKRCIRKTDSAMGEILGKYYVDKEFPGDSKQVAIEMIRRIQAAFQTHLAELSWMDDATRERAIEKAKAINNKVGYPDKWRDYSALTVSGDDLVANVLAARRFNVMRELKKIGGPPDKHEWYMSPPTVNAYYNPLLNEMVFPAGILQPPFFSHGFPAAMNYGAMGMVMGHELSHGFDDEGRQFDAEGRMTDWWTPASASAFEAQAACVVEQFDNYAIDSGQHINGKLTEGENIADLGGLNTAYRAYRDWQKDHGEQPPAVEGLTNDQLFFVAFAQAWCTVESPEYEKMLVTSNPHSPAKFRVNGPLSNLSAFHEAFACEEGTPMHPAKTCSVW